MYQVKRTIIDVIMSQGFSMDYRAKEHEQYLGSDTDDHQFVTLMQLLQAATGMYHIDEVFLWLTDKMIQHLKIDVAQIWTLGANPLEQELAVLRAASVHDQSMQTHIVTNPHIMNAVTTMLKERRHVQMQPVGNLFSQYQSSLLGRFGLRYCICCPGITTMTIPGRQSSQARGNGAVPSVVAVLAFLTYPRPSNFLISISQLLDQALLIAQRQGLLQTSSAHEVVTPVPETLQQILPPLHELIPIRVRPHNSMRLSSPFANSAPISDKRAMAFLSAIDGTRNVAQVAIHKKMDGRDVVEALRVLLRQERIQLCTREGKPVDSRILLENM